MIDQREQKILEYIRENKSCSSKQIFDSLDLSVSNAILMNERHCPLSFRTVDSIDYKKAILLFCEQNNISNFKEIYINQFEFAVNTYF